MTVTSHILLVCDNNIVITQLTITKRVNYLLGLRSQEGRLTNRIDITSNTKKVLHGLQYL